MVNETILFADLTADLSDKSAVEQAQAMTRAAAWVDFKLPIPWVDLRGKLREHTHLRYQTRPLSAVDRIIFHHTGGRPDATAEAIARWIIQPEPHGRNWPGFPYHFYILPNGQIHHCQDMTVQSYHVGNWNRRSVGVAIAGNFLGQSRPPEAQLRAVTQLIYLLQALYLPKATVVAHKEAPGASTRCPGDAWNAGLRWRNDFISLVDQAKEHFAPPAPPPSPARPPSPKVVEVDLDDIRAAWWHSHEVARQIEQGQHGEAKDRLLFWVSRTLEDILKRHGEL